MLVLGEDRPDVEDTTTEELLRQRRELEQARRELDQEAERRRKEAEERLAQERLAAERELARRQREIDDAERRLVRTEKRLRKAARKQGGGIEVPSGRRDPTPRGKLSPSHRAARRNRLLAAADRRSGVPVPRMPRAALLAVAASGLLVAGAVTSIDPPSPAQVQAFVDLDQARETWLTAGTTLDEEVTRYLAGEPVAEEGGPLRSSELAQQAAGLSGSSSFGRYVEVYTEGVAPLLQQPGTNPQRVLSAWSEARDRSSYAVAGYEVRGARELLDNDRVWPTLLLMGGLLATGALGYVLLRGGTRVGAALAGLALVPGALVLVNQDRHIDVEPAIEAHDARSELVDGGYDQVGRDLRAVLGVRALDSWEREDYWVDEPYWTDDDALRQTAVADYLQARAGLADVDLDTATPEESAAHALTLVGPGTALVTTGLEGVAEARDEVVAHSEAEVDLPPYVVTTAAAAALPLAALVPAVLRRREVS